MHLRRHHFELFAALTRNIAHKNTRDQQAAVLAAVFREANPRFDADRFLAACQPGAKLRVIKPKGK